MPNTYSQVYYHIVFSVENRQSILSDSNLEHISKYIWGIIKSLNGKPYIINGYKDHIHILTNIPLTISLSDFVKQLKSRSSKYVNEKNLFPGKFNWQTGYGIFTVSYSQLKKVIKYIDNQKEHHQKKSFQQEYLSLLKAHNIEFEQKYVFHKVEQ